MIGSILDLNSQSRPGIDDERQRTNKTQACGVIFSNIEEEGNNGVVVVFLDVEEKVNGGIVVFSDVKEEAKRKRRFLECRRGDERQ